MITVEDFKSVPLNEMVLLTSKFHSKFKKWNEFYKVVYGIHSHDNIQQF
jgi:hypothetical protein